MSTRSSMIFSHKFGLHIYQELTDNTVHIEVDRNGVLVDVLLGTYEEWMAAGCPTYPCVSLDGWEKDQLFVCPKCGHTHAESASCMNPPICPECKSPRPDHATTCPWAGVDTP